MENNLPLSDKELYSVCKKWGAAALEARRKFAGLLPEVQKRELAARAKGKSWLGRRGYSCLYEFAARLAGMSREQVNRVLQLDRKYSAMPTLHSALVEGQVSVNKLARIASIATVANQEALLERVRTMSKAAIDIFVKEYRGADDLFEGGGKGEVVPGHNFGEVVGQGEARPGGRECLHIDEEIIRAMSPELKQKIGELIRKGFDVNEILINLLEKREKEIAGRKAEVALRQVREAEGRDVIGIPAKRYVPAEVRNVVREEFGEQCAVVGCGKRAVNLHHERGFAGGRGHDPRYLKPLCRGHHELAHAGDQKVQKFRVGEGGAG